MKNFRIRYRPWGTSTAESEDIVVPAETEQEARATFEQHYPLYFFVSAREEM